MGSLNQVVLFGHLGADPKLVQTKQGTSVVNLRVATNATWKNKDGEKEERTDWHQVVVWGAQAERCAEHLRKGRAVLVTGRIQSRQWVDEEGEERYATEIIAARVEFVARPTEEAA